MNSVQASQAVFARFASMWPTLAGAIPFVFDNDVKPEAATFARCGIRGIGSEQWTLGPAPSRKWQRTMLIDVRLSGPINRGRKNLDTLAEYVRTIYEGVRFGVLLGEQGITTHATTVKELVRDREAGQTWILSAVTPAEYYDVR